MYGCCYEGPETSTAPRPSFVQRFKKGSNTSEFCEPPISIEVAARGESLLVASLGRAVFRVGLGLRSATALVERFVAHCFFISRPLGHSDWQLARPCFSGAPMADRSVEEASSAESAGGAPPISEENAASKCSSPGCPDAQSPAWNWQSFEEGLRAALAEHKIVYFHTRRSSDGLKESDACKSSLAADSTSPKDADASLVKKEGSARQLNSASESIASSPPLQTRLPDLEDAGVTTCESLSSRDADSSAASYQSGEAARATTPPLELAEGVLVDLKKRVLSATDFSSQIWCERQTELYVRSGRRKKATAAMKQGE